MGTKYSTQTISGYNSSPPVDDGTQSESNKTKWATVKTKIGDPVKTTVEAINSALVTAFDQSVRSVSAADSTVAGDHNRTIQIASTVTASITISLGDAATMAAGYIVTVANQSTVACVVDRATASNTINGVTSSVSILALESITFIVNSATNGYIIKSRTPNLSTITNSLGADVALNNTGLYFNGPSVAQGTTGTWFFSGIVTLEDTGAAAIFDAKLTDGTTVIASGSALASAANNPVTITLSGYLASPVGNVTIQVKDRTNTTGQIRFNESGNSKDSTLSAFRIG